jgi:Tol biopolymer transport system component
MECEMEICVLWEMKFLFLAVFIFNSTEGISQGEIGFTDSDTPQIFGAGVISDGFANRDMAISPEGNDLLYTVQWYFGLYSVILHSKKINGEWTKPDTAWFSGKFNDLEPSFSPDGNKLYFVSNRPVNKTDSPKDDYDIWYLQKKGKSWLGPFNLGAPVNTEKDEFYPSFTKSGKLYFTRNHDGAGDDIFFAQEKGGKWTQPEVLPDAVNSQGDDFNAFVDPDENYIIFSSYKRKDDLGKGDLYYSRRINGEWQPAIHFENGINSPYLDYSPFVTADHKYFFFTSKRLLIKFPFPKPKSAPEIRDLLNSYGNGFEDIYIMNFKEVEKGMQR